MEDSLNDDAVAALLVKDARDSAIKYSSLGMSAFLRDKPPANKPKPNTRFLRNLVRETDSHNAALLAREAAESKARLRELTTKDERKERDIRARQMGQMMAHITGGAPRRRKLDEEATNSLQRKQYSQNVPRKDWKEWNDRSRSPDRERRRSSRQTRSRERRSEQGRTDDDDDDDRLRRVRRRDADTTRLTRRHRSRSRSRSRSPRNRHKSRHRRRGRSQSPQDTCRNALSGESSERRRRTHRESNIAAEEPDSDPLEEIVGPLPPPKVKSRGRGTTASSSGIDARFSKDYDPKLDVANNGEDADDWELVLDRVKWKQQGADRLRQAGFTEEEIRSWETGKEKDVKWTKKGGTREWDREKLPNTDEVFGRLL